MKALLGLFVLLVGGIVRAETITLADGRVFADAAVVSTSAGRVCLRHAGGLTQIDKALLPPEWAARYPADAQAVAAEDATRAAAAEKQLIREEARAEQHRLRADSASPEEPPAAVSEHAITAAAEDYADDFFRHKYLNGSNDAVTLRVSVRTETPEPMAGWLDQYRVVGEASFTEYRSRSWGTFQKDSRRFEVVVHAPPGRTPKVKDFTLR